MAESYEQRLNTERQKLKDSIKDLRERRDNTSDAKIRKRLNGQIKAKTRKLNDLNQRWSGHRTGIDAKGGANKRVPTLADTQLHHAGSSLNNAAQFFDDLDPAEKLIMEKQFARFGIVPGDVSMNALAMLTSLHQGGIHSAERDLKLEGKEYFKPGATFQEKLNAVETFAKDQRTLQVLAEEINFRGIEETPGFSRRILQSPNAEESARITSREVQRRTEMSRDIREYSPEVHSVAGQQTRPQINTDVISSYRESILRRQLGVSPFMTGYTPPALGGFSQTGSIKQELPPTIKFEPNKLGGFQQTEPLPETPITPKQDLSTPVMDIETLSDNLQKGAVTAGALGLGILSTMRDVVFGFGNGL